MNNKIIFGVLAVVVIAGAIYFVTKNKDDNQVASNSQTEQNAQSASTENGSIKSLMASGKNQKCTFSTNKDGYSSNGTVYVGNSKVRGDFSVNTSQTQTHMINEGKTSYMWSDDGKVAFKMDFDPTDTKQVADVNAKAQQAVDVNQNFDWSCESWKVDNSKFELPSGITFSELPSIPSAGASAGSTTDINAIRKQACNALTGTAKEQCLAAIK